MAEFIPQTTTVLNSYNVPETVRNSHVPSNKSSRVFHFDAVKLLPESLREQFMAGMRYVMLYPFDHAYNEAVISMINAEDNLEYRMYVSDPVDENGKTYYTGQGYLPNIVFVTRIVGKWFYI